MIIVGIDPHSRSHAAAAIDEQGRLIEGIEVDAGPVGLAQLGAWIEVFPQPRLVAIENARGYALAIVRSLLAQPRARVAPRRRTGLPGENGCARLRGKRPPSSRARKAGCPTGRSPPRPAGSPGA